MLKCSQLHKYMVYLMCLLLCLKLCLLWRLNRVLSANRNVHSNPFICTSHRCFSLVCIVTGKFVKDIHNIKYFDLIKQILFYSKVVCCFHNNGWYGWSFQEYTHTDTRVTQYLTCLPIYIYVSNICHNLVFCVIFAIGKCRIYVQW